MLRDRGVARWFGQVSQGSKKTAKVYLRRLGYACDRHHTTPRLVAKLDNRGIPLRVVWVSPWQLTILLLSGLVGQVVLLGVGHSLISASGDSQSLIGQLPISHLMPSGATHDSRI
jgi:hypothetical protein